MSLRSRIDPELAILRSIGRAAQTAPNGRNDLESARFNLYAAAEQDDRDLAARWLDACRVVIEVAELLPAAREGAQRVLDRIASELDEQ